MSEKTGEMKGKAKEMKGEIKGKAKELEGEIKGKAKEAEGKIKGKIKRWWNLDIILLFLTKYIIEISTKTVIKNRQVQKYSILVFSITWALLESSWLTLLMREIGKCKCKILIKDNK